MKVKNGVITDGLKHPMKKPWGWYVRLYSLAGGDPTMTDGVSPRKDVASLHPKGYAIDVRIRDVGVDKASIIAKILQEVLGADYDVILYSTHIHIEYQRHLDDGEDWVIINIENVD